MKRLLAYLFIVLGLGLTFSVNANTEINLCKKNKFTNKDFTTPVIFVKKNACYTGFSKVSIEEYVDTLLNWKIEQNKVIFWNKSLTVKLIKSIKSEFIKNELDTNYLDEKIIKEFTGMSEQQASFRQDGINKVLIKKPKNSGNSYTFSREDIMVALGIKKEIKEKNVVKKKN